ncbi:hypothetical protein COCCADRAFT_39256 [Bipolaris zeicola 26-R-13]|uniref:D-lactate dehydrogenase (cytochrome) n=1 Tax=Cochliobolus carbonum (strain 26-R-13) TaxID=930089 RepID=W6Y5R6_COCC2|nr:uncharacterized protein COCCADRAFT_39256 [Bipolaris zeicola 26-R-13]EUC30529.1 hypothetical protein COCCADRAFT_39256 [Bipolaris zeicola 26-R-13]
MKRLLRLAQIFPAPTLRNCRLYSQHVVSPHISRKSPRVGIYFIALLALASTAFYAGSQSRPIAGAASQQATVTKQKPLYASRAELEKAIAELENELGSDAITTDDDELRRHGYSEWSTINIERMPVAIAYPKSTDQVSKIAKVCARFKIPIVPYSGGSSVEGNFSAPYGGICIDFANMDKIVALHERDMDVVVQPGIGWMELNRQLKSSGLFFPVDPGPNAMIGGMVGTSCSGTNAVRYGTMKDNVINLTVVLADGSIIKTRHRPRKTAAGYNLTSFFVGSEGTLGIITEATLKLAAIPAETKVGLATFPSVRDASNAATAILRAGIQMGAMEIMDEVQMDVVNRAGGTDRKWEVMPTMLVKFIGSSGQIAETTRQFSKIATSNGGGTLQFASTAEEQASLWAARKQALWSMLSLREGDEEVWTTDVAVPISRLPELIDMSKKEVAALGLFAGIVGHIGDGNFHAAILFDGRNAEQRARVAGCAQRMVARALEMEGTCTGEHGIGIGKKGFLKAELGAGGIAMMQKVKESLDPLWIMNPGKVFDHPLEDMPVGH